MRRAGQNGMGFGVVAFVTLALLLSAYFIFAAIQGDFGHFQRVQVEAEERVLQQRLSDLRAERARMANLTKRLSDDYLDLDLLDEQVRKRLGYARPDEIIIR